MMPPASQGMGATGASPADPAQGADSGAPDASSGYEICIRVDANQQITVSVDPIDPADQSDGSGGDGSGPEDSQAVPSIRAACQVVMDIYKNAGQMEDAGAEQDSMSSGYGAPAPKGAANPMGGM